jgi:hypothetical protein
MKKPKANWKWKGTYPVRCQIVDPTGYVLKSKTTKGKSKTLAVITANCPPKTRPHLGKTGKASLLKNGYVKIKLDDGTVLYGYECWWIPLCPKPA